MRKWLIAIGGLLGGVAAIIWQIYQHRETVKGSERLAAYRGPFSTQPEEVKEWEAEVVKKGKEITKVIEDGRKEEITRKWKEAFGDR